MSNALLVKVEKDGYGYCRPLAMLDDNVLRESKLRFQQLKDKHIISAKSFEAPIWYFDDEVANNTEISFQFNKKRFDKVCSPLLNCTAEDFANALRVYAIQSRYSVKGLQKTIRGLINYIDTLDRNQKSNLDPGIAFCLISIVNLLTDDQASKNSFMEMVAREAAKASESTGPRTLAFYESNFLFDHLLNYFWENDATPKEKLLYFPIYFWWNLTIHLPLRPTCCVLTPRNCLTYKDGKPYITVRRSKKKGNSGTISYRIKDDYDLWEYPILPEFAKEIEQYIAATNDRYCNDTDTLFCKATFLALRGTRSNIFRFFWTNLVALLDSFYQEIICDKYGYRLIEKTDGEPLEGREIEMINLGDTRHIAMINLMLSGNSPYTCQLLAGHTNITTGDNYYGNLKNMIHAKITMDSARVPYRPKFIYESVIMRPESVSVKGGLCFSQKYLSNDFSDCKCAVDEFGCVGACTACGYYLQVESRTQNKVSNAKKLGEPDDSKLAMRFTLFIEAMNRAREGLGSEEDIQITLERFQAEARLYTKHQMTWKDIQGGEENGWSSL